MAHCLWVVGSSTAVIHRHTACGHWAMELLQCTATLPGDRGQWNSYNALPQRRRATGVEMRQCTATLPVGSGQWNSCNALPHCLGTVGNGTRTMQCHTVPGQRQWNCCNALSNCLWEVGNGTPAMQCHSAGRQWAPQGLQCTAWGALNRETLYCTATVTVVRGQWNSCKALPHCPREWAMELLQCTATSPGGIRQGNCCIAAPHWL